MVKKHNTGRILVLSALAVCVCFAMLLGTTFAWFTDTAEVNVNTINTGKFDIDIVDATGTSIAAPAATARALNFVRMDNTTTTPTETPITGDILWEPNATYRTETFKVVNNGDYAVKFVIADVFATHTASGAKDLTKVLHYTVYIDGDEYMTYDPATSTATYAASEGEVALYPANTTGKASEASFYISIRMDENAGNDYQECSISGMAVNVSAAQMTYETDSNNDQYDANAKYIEEINATNP